jgi:hypothetical protein
MPNEAYGKGIYLSSLVLSRHWGIRAQNEGIWDLDLDEDSGGLRRERIGVEQIRFEDVGG